MMIKKTAVAASVVTIAAVFWIATQIRTPAPLPPEKVKFGLAMQESSGLAMIADAKGFFAAENLEVDITPYASGKRALEEGLFGSREEIVTTAEVPIALGSFERSDFRVVASINETDNFSRIVGNKQEGVLTPSDLRGKRLGIQPISATHFFLHLFLLEHGIDETEVNFIYLKSEELPDALKEGKVAAASLREPQLTLTKQKLGSDAAVFFSEGIYTQFEALVANERLIRERPEVITRFLKALLRAESFADQHPEEARAIIARTLDIEPQQVETSHRSVNLKESHIALLEDEARWIRESKMAPTQNHSDLNALIDCRFLEKIDPRRVSVIR
jgi:sulfonate transport system substrate-binding protein